MYVYVHVCIRTYGVCSRSPTSYCVHKLAIDTSMCIQCILGYPNLDYPTPRLSECLKLVTAHAQSINFNMAAIIFVGDNTAVAYSLWSKRERTLHYRSSVSCSSLQWRYLECQESYF